VYAIDNASVGTEPIRFLIVTGFCGIGDALFISPVAETIKEIYPHSHVTVLARNFPWVGELFGGMPAVDDVFVYDYERRGGIHRGIRGIFRLRRELSLRNIDVAVVVHHTFRAAFIAYLSGAAVRIGYDTEHRRMLLTEYMREPDIEGVGYYLLLLTLLGVKRKEFVKSLKWKVPDAAVCQSVEKVQAPYVVFIPTTSWALKNWPVDYYLWLLERLLEDGVRVVVVGKGERARKVGKVLGEEGALNLVDRFDTLSELGCLLEDAAVVVGGDTGVLHLASAMGVKSIALWGPTSPFKMVSRMSCRVDFFLSYPCYRICRKTLADTCPYESECMKAIRPEWVYETLTDILGEGSSA